MFASINDSLAKDSSPFYLCLAFATMLYVATNNWLNHFIIFDAFGLVVSVLFYIPTKGGLFAAFGYCCANWSYLIYYITISQILQCTEWNIAWYMGYQCSLRSISFIVFTLLLIWYKKSG